MDSNTKPVIFDEGNISTGQEGAISFAPNGETAYFSRGCEPPFCIMESHFENGVWTKPVIASFSGKYHDVDPFVSSDGNKLYFSSRRPDKVTGNEYCHIWVVERDNNVWGEPKELDYPINTEYNEVFPAITVVGTLYFTSSRPGGKGFSDIYYSKLVNGEYTEPCRLNGNVSTEEMEFDAYIASDESFMIFTRNTKEIGFDMFLTFNENGSWTEPKSLRKLIGFGYHMTHPSLSHDRKRLYFSSGGNIYYINDFGIYLRQ